MSKTGYVLGKTPEPQNGEEVKGCLRHSREVLRKAFGDLFGRTTFDFALEYIEMLESAQPKWISVEERLPDIENENGTAKCTETVLGVDKLGYQYVGFFRIYKYDNSFEFVGCDCDGFDRGEFDVTHWVPLPEPPKEEA